MYEPRQYEPQLCLSTLCQPYKSWAVDVRLINAIFHSANLTKADFTRAVLDGAAITGAGLDGVNLNAARGISSEQLLDTDGDPVRLPDGKPPAENWREKLKSPRKRSPRKPKARKPSATDAPSPEPPTGDAAG
jgi:hypothetical protein